MLVNILLSTYNGGKYLSKQLDSILQQSFQNFKIYIRDDGSSDDTVDIIMRYAEKFDCIQYDMGKNIGYGPSFMELLSKVTEGDLWAFCDQDDVWLPDKIQRGVQFFENISMKQPVMYSSSYYQTDASLNIEKEIIYHNEGTIYTFPHAITECRHLGFTCIFNAQLRSMALRADIDKLVTHDWWMELVAMEFGTIYEDSKCTTFHRRLTDSVSVMTIGARMKWLKKAWKGNAEIKNCTQLFYQTFSDCMKEKDCNVLKLFIDEKYNVWHAIKKACYPKRWRSALSSEFVIRALMLMGKI